MKIQEDGWQRARRKRRFIAAFEAAIAIMFMTACALIAVYEVLIGIRCFLASIPMKWLLAYILTAYGILAAISLALFFPFHKH